MKEEKSKKEIENKIIKDILNKTPLSYHWVENDMRDGIREGFKAGQQSILKDAKHQDDFIFHQGELSSTKRCLKMIEGMSCKLCGEKDCGGKLIFAEDITKQIKEVEK